ncbi:MAG TPA: chloride channel protein, partial [Firmicutes bacterium]|nr:chloride channel protein [Bacillota bacterium]
MKNFDKKRYKGNRYYRYMLKSRSFLNKSGVLNSGKWIYYGIIIGTISAFGAALLVNAINYTNGLLLSGVVGYKGNELEPLIFLPGAKKWLILVIPALGALLAGIISVKLAPDTKGHGTDSVIKCFHKGGGNMKIMTPIVKIISTTLVIGSGGSAGREGPIAQIGAGFASFMGRRLKVTAKDRRIMLISGAGAGISALFGAPLGGAIFAIEVLYRNHDMESEALIPSLFSSIVAFSVFRTFFGEAHLFNIANVSFHTVYELVPYIILGISCFLVGVLYIKIFNRIRAEFARMKINEIFKPALGGFLVGAMALFLPQILAGGYGYIQMALDGELSLKLMLALIIGKILATSLTIGSGGSGGVFAPSLFIGAMLGGSIGGVMQQIFPAEWISSSSVFVVVGMGGFFAGVARVPLSSLFMVSEMTRGYELLVPMMFVSSISFLLNRKPYTLYEEQAKSIIDSPAHKGDFETDILENIKVSDVKTEKDVIKIPRRMTLDNVI